ncbi:sensor histidine kinase [Streptomyces sp. NPDC059582]|uniref:sensor histidine kinase n=1 Tax=Streptomyces sp. NPDC059582 TaxID=3346875 RepID=UPI0036A61925
MGRAPRATATTGGWDRASPPRRLAAWPPGRLAATPLDLGDEARLRQVAARLPADARARPPVGTRGVAGVESSGSDCVVRVRDDGPGIPADLLPSVFERRTRGDASRARAAGAAGGSGLGLPVAAAITAAHGGPVDVRGEPGRTDFTVGLPSVVQDVAPPGGDRHVLHH